MRAGSPQQLYGQTLDPQAGDWVYVGDSTNDQLMFQCFRASVGVANVRRFEAQLQHKPRYITDGERGAGFAEVARAGAGGAYAALMCCPGTPVLRRARRPISCGRLLVCSVAHDPIGRSTIAPLQSPLA